MKINKVINIVTGILVLALAVGALVLSYDALRGLAEDNGITVKLAWVWPLVVDGFLVVASLAVVRNSLLGERTAYPWGLVILFTISSVVFNILNSPSNPLAQIIGAVPPVALVLAFELAMSVLRSEAQRSTVVTTLAGLMNQADDKRLEVTNLTQRADQADIRLTDLKAELIELRKEKRTIKRANTVKIDTLELARATRKEQAQEAIDGLLAFYADNPLATQAVAGASVSRSRQWVSATLANLETKGAIERTEQGVQVLMDVEGNDISRSNDDENSRRVLG